MKTTENEFKRSVALAVLMLFASTILLADGGASEIYLNGKTTTGAGEYVVVSTDDVYHYMGQEYMVYNVYYDNPRHNMKIAVLNKDYCKTFIAYNNDYWFMYECTGQGFGIRKVMFSNPSAADRFDAQQFNKQSILVKKRRIGKEEAIGLIASYVPHLQDSEKI